MKDQQSRAQREPWIAVVAIGLAGCGASPATHDLAHAAGKSGAEQSTSTAAGASGASMLGSHVAGSNPSPSASTSAGAAGGTNSAGRGSDPSGAAGNGMSGQAGRAGAAADGASGFYRMERLQRGLVALPAARGIFVSWRMLASEYVRDQPELTHYELYRDGEVIADVKDSTNYLDEQGTASSRYSVRVLLAAATGEKSSLVAPWAQPYLRIPLQPPAAGYTANDASVGDVDGDGDYELVLKWEPSDAKDNSQSGMTSPVFLDTLDLDGTRLARIDLGPNIRAGAHYTQFIVFDLDGDGKAEITVKTAPGTRSGTGAYLSMGPARDDDDSKLYRNSNGYILTGPEYLTVFAGATGAELATANFDVARGDVAAWGDDYGNRVDRFLAAAAYLDDTGLPSVIMARGYYTRSTLTAWNFRDGGLAQSWKFDSQTTPRDDKGRPYSGQGSHNLSIANIDSDRQQEIVYGAMAVDHDGRGKCSTGFNHGDALHVGDFVPGRPGLEVFMPNEDGKHPAYYMRDANSCDMVFTGPITGDDTGRAVAGDVSSEHPGAEVWAAGNTGLLDAASGERVGDDPKSINFLVWWDGDETRELEDKTSISKYGGGTLVSCAECAANNGTKSNPSLVADLFGDWREEVVWREADNSALRIYTTNAATSRRMYTLMHDPQYRVAIAWQNVAYNQPPHPSFFIGVGMEPPPQPDIRTH